ncbi:MAG: CocE/NonD family hydrolase [Sphingomonadales bacterium]|nr:MAG: CocE/NonD family hydrolase [Sphingomonadales bacterium]
MLVVGLQAMAPVAQAKPAQSSVAEEIGTNDIPATFANPALERDYIERDVMIPMRDGVKLKTIIMIPKSARGAPIILTRTPYDAASRTHRSDSPKLRDTLPLSDEELSDAGYIRVYQDVRGKFGSKGKYVMMLPPRGPLNTQGHDHSTDAYDTIDWLVKNVPESNGRVGMIGSSYEGFTAAMALLEPHPALRAVVPESPVIDAWMGDDWFHHGAFRTLMLGFVQMQTGQTGPGAVTPNRIYDKYEELLRAGSVADYAKQTGIDKLPWVKRTLDHPAYTSYWSGQALDKLLAAKPSNVPTLWEQGLWDQEDMWGANHAWLAQKEAGHKESNWLVMGPWSHSQAKDKGYTIGPLKLEGDTSKQYRKDMVLPFFEHYLRDGPAHNLSRVTVYNTGENRWEKFDDWAGACKDDCADRMTPLYLRANAALSFTPPVESDGQDNYVSDPAKPVPFLKRPVLDPFFEVWTTGKGYLPWSEWLQQDQRFVDGRPDVLTYETSILDAPVHVRGVPVADILAATTGTDGDFVVKLIDVYPAMVPGDPDMSGYQLAISLDIFRGRYRNSFSEPQAIPANSAQRYRFELPGVNHVFQPGHRIMIQIQSTLFPLYDRNPQTYTPNIFYARPEDYQAAKISILRSKEQSTKIWLPVVKK